MANAAAEVCAAATGNNRFIHLGVDAVAVAVNVLVADHGRVAVVVNTAACGLGRTWINRIGGVIAVAILRSAVRQHSAVGIATRRTLHIGRAVTGINGNTVRVTVRIHEAHERAGAVFIRTIPVHLCLTGIYAGSGHPIPRQYVEAITGFRGCKAQWLGTAPRPARGADCRIG